MPRKPSRIRASRAARARTRAGWPAVLGARLDVSRGYKALLAAEADLPNAVRIWQRLAVAVDKHDVIEGAAQAPRRVGDWRTCALGERDCPRLHRGNGRLAGRLRERLYQYESPGPSRRLDRVCRGLAGRSDL